MESVSSILEQQCRRHTVATIISTELGVACRGQFAAFSKGTVTFEVLAPPDAILFRPLSVAVVCFHSYNRGSTFLSSVIDFKREQPWLGKLIVRSPSEIFSTEARVAVRIPLPANTKLSVRAKTATGKVLPARPVDISLCGMLIEFPSDDVPELKVDEQLRVELQHGEHRFAMTSVVRRRDNMRYGLLFPEVIRGIEFDPPTALRQVVELVQEECSLRQAQADSVVTDRQGT